MRAESEVDSGATTLWRNGIGQFLLLAIAFAVFLLIRTGSTSYYSNDAVQYWSTISNLLQGNGIRTSAVYYEVQAAHGLPAHQTVWPPGMPLLAAAVAWLTGWGADRAVAVINALAHGTTAVLLYWLLWRLRDSRLVAAAFSLAFLLYAPVILVVLSGLSEPFSTLATTAAIASIAKAYSGPAQRRLSWLALAAVAVGAGSWFRYQVIFLVVPLGLVCLAALWRKEGMLRSAAISAVVISPAILAFGALLLRNLLLTGAPTGGNSAARGNSLSELAFQAKWAILSFFGGGAGWLDRVLIVAFSLAAIGCLVLAWRHRLRWQTEVATVNAMTGAFALTGAALTTSIILVLASRSTFYTLEGRYFHGALVLAVVGLAALWPRGTWSSDNKTIFIAVRIFAASAAALILLQLNGLREFVRSGGEVTAMRRALAVTHEGRTLEDFLRGSLPLAAPVMSNQSQLLHLILQRPTFSVPERRLTPTLWNGDQIIAAARRFGVTHLIVFQRMPLGSTDGSTDYVWQLAQKPTADLAPILETADIRLYRVIAK